MLPWLPKLNIDSRFLLCSFSGLGRSGSLWRFFTITSPLRLIDSVFSGIFGSSFSFFIVLSAFSTAISFIISALGVLSFCAGCSFLGLGFSCFEVSFVLFFSAVLVVVFLAAVFGSAFCAVFDSLFSLVFSVVVLAVVFFAAGFLAVFLVSASFAFFWRWAMLAGTTPLVVYSNIASASSTLTLEVAFLTSMPSSKAFATISLPS